MFTILVGPAPAVITGPPPRFRSPAPASVPARVDVFVPCRELYREAFLLARTARRPAYDMFCLALARREDAAFLTTDTGLRKEAERQGIRLL